MSDYILFDLDGTLTDPKVGITTCVQYALHSFGIEEQDLDKLTPFIGPPLKESFMEYYDFSEEQAEQAIEKYRERFKDTGIFENTMYPGIADMLRKLKGNSKKLAVASSKPTVFVERILEHFEIRKYFDVVVGSELDGTRTDKAEVVREALKRLYGEAEDTYEQKKKETLMVGDRKFDVAGAKAEEIASVAVTYGYGPLDEIRIAKPTYVAKNVEELEKILLKGTEKTAQKATNPAMSKLWILVFPALMFYFVQQLGSYVGFLLINFLTNALPRETANYLVVWDEAGEKVTGPTGLGNAIIVIIAFIITGYVTWKYFAKKDLFESVEIMEARKDCLRTPLAYCAMGAGAIGAAVGLNFLLELVGITNASAIYQEVAAAQYTVPIVLGIILYGIVIPFIEEMMFRGVIYNRARKHFKPYIAGFISALFFGIYHQNLVQGIYAFIMGCLICYFYEKSGRFLVTVLVHVVSNLTAYLMTYVGGAIGLKVNWPACIIMLVIAVGSVVYLFFTKTNREEQMNS